MKLELQQKKDRLAELKKKRQERKGRIKPTRSSARSAAERKAARDRKLTGMKKPNVLDSINDLIGTDPKSSAKSYGSAPTLSVSTPKETVINIGTSVPVTYNKSVECGIIGGTD